MGLYRFPMQLMPDSSKHNPIFQGGAFGCSFTSDQISKSLPSQLIPIIDVRTDFRTMQGLYRFSRFEIMDSSRCGAPHVQPCPIKGTLGIENGSKTSKARVYQVGYSIAATFRASNPRWKVSKANILSNYHNLSVGTAILLSENQPWPMHELCYPLPIGQNAWLAA